MTAKRKVAGLDPASDGIPACTLLTCSCGLCGNLGEGSKTGENLQEGQMKSDPSHCISPISQVWLQNKQQKILYPYKASAGYHTGMLGRHGMIIQ